MNLNELLSQAKSVREMTGKRLSRQALEILRLIAGRGKVSPSEYYEYCIYDDARLDWTSKQEFIGYRVEGVIEPLFNDVEWRSVANDKLVFYATLHAQNLDYPKMLAVFHPRGRTLNDAVQLRTVEAMLNYLRTDAEYPMFAKPNRGSTSRGVFSLMSYERNSDCVVLGNTEKVKLNDLFTEHGYGLQHGYLFQELLEPHPKILEMCGNRLSGLRVVVFLSDSGPKVVRAMWKVPVGNAMTDCFRGHVGNYIASVDTTTGEVTRVIAGSGISMKEESCHPDTGQLLLGERLPDWDRLVSYCDAAGRMYPGLRLQHWDIALCDRGPVPVELNVNGGLGLPQLAYGAGLMDAEMQSYMKLMQNRQPAF